MEATGDDGNEGGSPAELFYFDGTDPIGTAEANEDGGNSPNNCRDTEFDHGGKSRGEGNRSECEERTENDTEEPQCAEGADGVVALLGGDAPGGGFVLEGWRNVADSWSPRSTNDRSNYPR